VLSSYVGDMLHKRTRCPAVAERPHCRVH